MDIVSARGFLLDTSCFFAVAGNTEKQTRLRLLGSRVAATAVAVVEIAAPGKGGDDFLKRKRAMQALEHIHTVLLPETPNYCVARAFKRPIRSRPPFNAFNVMRAIVLANSYAEAKRGVRDPLGGVVRRVNAQSIRQLKNLYSQRAVKSMAFLSATIRNIVSVHADKAYPKLDSKSRRGQAREWISKHTESRLNGLVLLALAVQAGLFTHSDVSQAMDTDTDDTYAEMAREAYDGSLEPYMAMFTAYLGRQFGGQNPERNDMFDMEFLKYLDAYNTRYVYVTAEKSGSR